MTFAKRPDGTMFQHGDPGSAWTFSPLYEETTSIPLIVHVPGAEPNVYNGLTSAIDVMPTVLEVLGQDIPEWVEGKSLLSNVRDTSTPGREFTVTTVPFADPGDPVRSVDNFRRKLESSLVTTVSTDEWVLLYTTDEGMSQLYHLPTDPGQETQRHRRQSRRGARGTSAPRQVHAGHQLARPPDSTKTRTQNVDQEEIRG